jgi:hypothetical protein
VRDTARPAESGARRTRKAGAQDIPNTV